jgi:hypothetical protein
MLLRNNMLSQCKRCKQVKDDVHYCSWGHHSALCKAGNIPSRINVLNPPDSLVSNERDQTGGATEYKVVKLDKQGVAASKAKKKLPPVSAIVCLHATQHFSRHNRFASG